MPDKDGHPSAEEMDLGRIFAALADPLRRQVVRTLAADPDGRERSCASFALPVAKATCTHHFRVLREAGLIAQDDRGNTRLTRLRRAELEQRFPGLVAMLLAEEAERAEPAAAEG